MICISTSNLESNIRILIQYLSYLTVCSVFTDCQIIFSVSWFPLLSYLYGNEPSGRTDLVKACNCKNMFSAQLFSIVINDLPYIYIHRNCYQTSPYSTNFSSLPFANDLYFDI